jgi:hypothetical protein
MYVILDKTLEDEESFMGFVSNFMKSVFAYLTNRQADEEAPRINPRTRNNFPIVGTL